MHPQEGAVYDFLRGADMIPTIDPNGKLLYEQVYEFYRNAIINKRLVFNDKLPSYRKLAKELQIGKNTVLRSYELLIHEGYVTNKSRKGLFVAHVDTEEWNLPSNLKNREHVSTPLYKSIKANFKLAGHTIDEINFPLKNWRKCTNWALDKINFQYEDAENPDPLKEQLIKYLFHFRGVVATPERLIIGSGTNAILFWLAFILQKTHSRIIFEEPCYPRPRTLFSEFGYKIVPISVRAEGIDLDKLLTQKADLLYLTPSHQFPTGSAIPVGNRVQILNWAKKNNAYIIEDDFDCEFRYKAGLMPSLQGLDNENRVIYIGTFSNSIMPSLRVAYMVLPENFPSNYQPFVYLINTVAYTIRKTLYYFMERGYWERHLKKMRKIYNEKYNVCVEALTQLPKNTIYFNQTPTGLNILLRINTPLSEDDLLKRAVNNGIYLTPASEFYFNKNHRPPLPEILFEFGNIPADKIETIVKKLYESWFDSVV